MKARLILRTKNLLTPQSCARQLRWRGVLLAGAIVAESMLSMPAAAQGRVTVTDAVGGSGGGPFRLTCPSGMAMVGLNARHGAWVDALAPICAVWVRGNRTLGEIDEGPGTGGPGGGSGWMRCQGPRGVTVGLHVWRMKNRSHVGRVYLECGNYEEPGKVANKLPGGADGIGQSFDGQRFTLRCGSNQIAVGIYGRSGAFIDRVGLLCQRSLALPQT